MKNTALLSSIVLWLPIKDTCLTTGSTGRESGSKEKNHTSRDRHWRPGRNRRGSCESQEVHGAVLLQLLLLCGQWRILLCMGARSFSRTGSLCVQHRLENPILRETKSHISGWQWLMDCNCLAEHWAKQGLMGSPDTCRKKGLPHNSWTQRELWPYPPSLSQKWRCCSANGRQAELWSHSADLWFLLSYYINFQWS